MYKIVFSVEKWYYVDMKTYYDAEKAQHVLNYIRQYGIYDINHVIFIANCYLMSKYYMDLFGGEYMVTENNIVTIKEIQPLIKDEITKDPEPCDEDYLSEADKDAIHNALDWIEYMNL